MRPGQTWRQWSRQPGPGCSRPRVLVCARGPRLRGGIGPQGSIFLGTYPRIMFPEQLRSARGWDGAWLLLAAACMLLREVGVAMLGPALPLHPQSPGQNCRAPVCTPGCRWAPEQFSECSCGQRVLSWRGVEAFLRQLPAQNCFSLFSAGIVLMTKRALSQLFLSRVVFFPYLSTYFLQYTGPIMENCNYNPCLGDSMERGQLRNIVCRLLWAKRGRERWASEALSLEAYGGWGC